MRKKLLVNPKFQFRFLALILCTVLVSVLTCYLILEAGITTAFQSDPAVQASWLAFRGTLRWEMAILVGILLLLIGIEYYFFSHGIAGPLFVLERSIQQISQGKFREQVHFRKTDQLRDVVRSFEAMRGRLQLKYEKQEERIKMILKQMEKLISSSKTLNSKELRRKIKAIQEKMGKKAA